MTDDLNVNDNGYKRSTTAEEFNKDVGGEMVAPYEEITVMKTEVKEEMYDFEMSVDKMVCVNTEQETHFGAKIIFKEEDLVLANSTAQSLNENHVDGNCENQEADLQNNKYICHLCHSEFRDETYLKNHYEQCFNFTKKVLPENKDAEYECVHCAYSTPMREQFVTHIAIHNGDMSNGNLTKHKLKRHSSKQKYYNCKECKYETHNKAKFTQHMHVHSNDKPFKCTYKNCKCAAGQEESCECSMCCYAGTCSLYLRKHILSKHSAEPKMYQCSNCKFATLRKASLEIHNRIHTGEKPFKCSYKNCKCIPGQEDFCECNTCGFAFTNNNGLRKHILTKHNAEPKKYKCSQCTFAAYFKAVLVRHNSIHTGEKPFKCTYKNCKCTPGQEEFCECNTCEFASATKRSLKGHIMAKHSDEPKKYKCSQCNFAAYFKAALVRHSSIHTGEKTFKCTYENCKSTLGQE